jgi:hypothetical protein
MAAFVINPAGKVIKKVAKIIKNKLKQFLDFDFKFIVISLLF